MHTHAYTHTSLPTSGPGKGLHETGHMCQWLGLQGHDEESGPGEDGGVGLQDRDKGNSANRVLTSLELGISSGGRVSSGQAAVPCGPGLRGSEAWVRPI